MARSDARSGRNNRRNRMPSARLLDIPEMGEFYRRESCSYTPRRILEELLSLFNKPLEESKKKKRTGSIYLAQVSNTPYVKIGITTEDDPKKRLRRIAKEHNQDLDIAGAFHVSDIDVSRLNRLEQLVQKDLAYFRRDIRPAGENAGKSFTEYFRVSLDHAKETIHFWNDVMNKLDVKAGNAVSPSIREAVTSIALSKLPRPEAVPDPESWQRVNSNTAHRLEMWKAVFDALEERPARTEGVDMAPSDFQTTNLLMLLALMELVRPEALKAATLVRNSASEAPAIMPAPARSCVSF